MRSRWLRFILAIVTGIGLGLLVGWLISPVKYVNTTPDSLGGDYKTDYVLMVAEVYQAEGNLTLAAQRLALLGKQPPLQACCRPCSRPWLTPLAVIIRPGM
jgi:hypothetical protein